MPHDPLAVRIHLITRESFVEVLAVSPNGRAVSAQLLRLGAALIERGIFPSINPGAWQPSAVRASEFRARFTVEMEGTPGSLKVWDAAHTLRRRIAEIIEAGEVDGAGLEMPTTLATEAETAEEVR